MNNVVLFTQSWNGYESCSVCRCASRGEAIEKASADSGIKNRYPHLSTITEFDDDNRILIHVQHGREFHGWRIFHTFYYFDQDAVVKDEYDEEKYEKYKSHLLSILVGELVE